MNRVSELTRPIKRYYKFVLSFIKSNWTLNDFPIEFRQQEMLDLSGTNLTMFPWEARIINWYWMNGSGNSKMEAYINLKERFEAHLAEGLKLPRPGTNVKVRFASVSRIDTVEKEAVDFFKDIFDMDYYGMFISDESSMYDFCWADELLNEKKLKIQEVYGIQIDDIEGLKIVGILEEIKEGTGIT
jgi:hypothetical protein